MKSFLISVKILIKECLIIVLELKVRKFKSYAKVHDLDYWKKLLKSCKENIWNLKNKKKIEILEEEKNEDISLALNDEILERKVMNAKSCRHRT